MNRVIAQMGWCFRVLETHLLSRKMIASKCWLEGGGMWVEDGLGGPPVYCVLLQCDGGFMKVLYCSILGKLDLTWGILAFLNSCVWQARVLENTCLIQINSLKNNGKGVVNRLCVWFKSLTWSHSLSREVFVKVFMLFLVRLYHYFPRRMKFSCHSAHR